MDSKDKIKIKGKTGFRSERYAKALFSILDSASDREYADRWLSSFSDIVKNSPELRTALLNPTISRTIKFIVIKEICLKLDLKLESIIGLFNSLICNDAFDQLEFISNAFSEMIKSSNNLNTYEVVSASELDAKEKDSLRTALKEKYGKEADLIMKVDKSILGGLSIESRESVLDATLITKIDDFAEAVTR
jgi:F-type H+-transporting ATPase subunit delta